LSSWRRTLRPAMCGRKLRMARRTAFISFQLMCCFSSSIPQKPRASSLPFSTAPQPYPELSQCMYADSTGRCMFLPLAWRGTCVHHCRSRLSCGVRRTRPPHLSPSTECNSRRKNRAVGIARKRYCAWPANDCSSLTCSHLQFLVAIGVELVWRASEAFPLGRRSNM
jgi:hypothetical protein